MRIKELSTTDFLKMNECQQSIKVKPLLMYVNAKLDLKDVNSKLKSINWYLKSFFVSIKTVFTNRKNLEK